MSKEKNQNKYNKKRAKILLKGIIPSLFTIFIPKIKNRIIFNSTRNEYFNFNSKYLFEYFIKNYSDYEIKFVMNNKEKRDKLNKEYGKENNYFIETETLKGIWYVLRAKGWVCSALETPIGGVFQKINRFVYHVGHGAYFRSAGFLENYFPWHKKLYYHLIKNNFSYHLITSDEIAKVADIMFACKKEQLNIIGEPMNDIIYTPNKKLLYKYCPDFDNSKSILYAPTWRQDGTLKLFPFDDMNWENFINFLEKENITFYLRMHPSFEEDLSFYTNMSNKFKILDNSKVGDVNEVMGAFDMLITDYSSIFTSFLPLNRPLLFLPYDLDKYEQRMGFVMDYHKATPGPKPKNLVTFQDEILKLFNDKNYYKEEREKSLKLFHNYTKDNCEMNSEFIVKKLKG